jgi:3-methyladenine DNA glycosylase AlkC
LEKLFDAIRPFAADEHFGVREIAWLAVRHRIIQDLEKSLAILSEWSQHENKNIRRFASEATRPRGVWCAHIVALKEKPELALALLDPLKSDKSKYVQNSVANWLNDARKTQALWVKNICDEWTRVSDSPETAYIIKRALRSLKS